MDVLIRLAMRNGFVTAPINNIEGVAVWIDSAIKSSPLLDGLSAGIISLFKNIDLKSFIRFSKIGSAIEKARSSITKDTDCYILDSIGVDPQYQNQGFAHMLINSKRVS